MTESNPPSDVNDSALLELLKTLPGLRAARRFAEVRQILADAIHHHGTERPEIMRELIVGIADIPVLLRYCASLINDYRARWPDLFSRDLALLEAMAICAWALEQWEAVASAQAMIIACRKTFALEDHVGLATALSLAGRYDESDGVLACALSTAETMAARRRATLARGQRLCIPVGIQDTLSRTIGEMALEFDLFYRGTRLGLLEAKDRAVIVNDELVRNRALLGYWKEKVVVYDSSSLPFRTRIAMCEDARNSLTCLMIPGIGCVDRTCAYAILNELWYDRGLPPVLTLKPRHRSDGLAALARAGIGPNDWFVGLHVREEGWAGEAASGHNKFRSAAIADYMPMVEAITRRGGWVVRLGDLSMTPLPTLPRVFDYALSDLKSDWMDLFLCAAARFVVATQSGVHWLATLFGTPVVLTNYLPMTGYPIAPNDMIIHKTLSARSQQRRLSIRATASPPMLVHAYKFFFEDQDIDAIPNTSEEITDVCVQMLDHLDGRAIYDDRDLALWQTYRDRTTFRGHRFRYRPGRLFLRNVEPLLDAT